MARIAIAGFQHETNSFVKIPTCFADFEMADSWPGLLRGAEVINGTKGMNLPIAGFVEDALADGIGLLPVLWCAAEPSGRVDQAAFDCITSEIIEALSKAGPVDGVYLDLHGAMMTSEYDDGEGEFLRRLRSELGEDLPIVISLDMHANITPEIVSLADEICLFKTYPHLDMAATGGRCYDRLSEVIRTGKKFKSWRNVDFLIPTHAQSTGQAPLDRLYPNLIDEVDKHVEMAVGFTAGDCYFCGPSIVAYASSQEQADGLADRAIDQLQAAEGEFDASLLSPTEAARTAVENQFAKPIVLADVQDNPGAGASSDTMGILHALVAVRASGVLLGLVHDPELCQTAHAVGQGQTVEGSLGGRSGVDGDDPYKGSFVVETISNQPVRYTGEMYGGGFATFGPSAVLKLDSHDIRVVITSIRNQCLDLGQFTHFGLNPAQARIIVVKSTVHFRADFEPVASQIINVAAPGQFSCELSNLDYRALRPGVRRL